ncbi:MAG TPA: FkbM family methyltransferase [Anaerolineales bacterium]
MPNLILSLAASAARLLPDPAKQAIYRVRPLARLIRGSLNRAAPKGLAQVTVAAGGLQGLHLLLDMQSEKDYWLGTYEPELQAAVADWVRPGMVIYDVGANIGYISLLLSRVTGKAGQIFAFEALPANQERIRANLELNEMTARMEVVPCAVVDRSRPVRFLVGPSNGMGKAEGSAGRQEVRYGEAIEVPGIALDEFVYETGNPEPQLVKMDIEGGEVLALPGMQRLLAEARPLILLELHGPEAAEAAWKQLVSAGYRICRMVPGYPGVPSYQALDWKAYIVAMPIQ